MTLIVTSAQIPGKPAPQLIDDESLRALRAGAVIIDLAAETGGNTSRTKANEVVNYDGIRIFGPTNLSSTFPTDASRLFSANLRALLLHLLDEEGRLTLSHDDEITRALLGEQTTVRPDVTTRIPA